MEVNQTQIVRALAALTAWAVAGNKHGNPYTKPEVRAAMTLLTNLSIGEGHWSDLAVSDLHDIAENYKAPHE